MDFVLTEEQQMFQKLFRDFAAKEVAKVADQTDKKEEFPAKLIKRAAGQGFLGAFAPEEPYGGAGLDFTTYTLLVEAMAAECASTALTLHVHNVLALRTIVKHGTEAVKEAFVPEMVAGDRIGAFALTESGRRQRPDAAAHGRVPRRRSVRASPAPRRGSSMAGVAGRIRRLCGDGSGRRRKGHQRVRRARRGGRRRRGRPREDAGPAGRADQPAVPQGRACARRVPAGRRGRGLPDRPGNAGLRPGGHFGGRGRRGHARPSSWRRSTRPNAPSSARRSQTSRPSRCTWPTRRRRCRRRSGWCATPRGWRIRASRSRRRRRWQSCSPARMAGEVTNKMLQVHGGAGFIADYPIERYYRDARAMELVEGTSQMQQSSSPAGCSVRLGVKVQAVGGRDGFYASQALAVVPRDGARVRRAGSAAQGEENGRGGLARPGRRPQARRERPAGHPLPAQIRRRRAGRDGLLPADGDDGRRVHFHRHTDRRAHRHRRDGDVPGWH